jgi:glutaredoxin-related protein
MIFCDTQGFAKSGKETRASTSMYQEWETTPSLYCILRVENKCVSIVDIRIQVLQIFNP